MTTEDNKLISRRLLEKLWNEQDISIIDELIADNYVDRTITPYVDDGELQGPETFKKVATAIQNAFFNVHVTIEDQIAEGDKVVTNVIWEYTLRSDDPAIAGQIVNERGIGIDRIDQGLIVENWNTLDILYRLISLFNLDDPFIDPAVPLPAFPVPPPGFIAPKPPFPAPPPGFAAPKPPAIKPPAVACDIHNPKPCIPGFKCVNGKCVK